VINKANIIDFYKKKLKIELPCDPAIPLLGLYPKEYESGLLEYYSQ
jgi:hypothetical protein